MVFGRRPRRFCPVDDPKAMKFIMVFLLWCLLFVVSWPLAILAILIFPVVWVVALPFRLLAALLVGLISLVKAILCIPLRLVGWRPARTTPANGAAG